MTLKFLGMWVKERLKETMDLPQRQKAILMLLILRDQKKKEEKQRQVIEFINDFKEKYDETI